MATRRDWYKAAALALRDRIVHRWLIAEKQSYDAGRKRVYYLSLEFLIGRLFTDALNNMGLLPVFETALGDLGVSLPDLSKCEPDAALGNGGLGRLAACFMESMATLAIPAIGYGIRYDFGLFRQIIQHGWQQEYPDEWLGFGNPWEFQRPEVVYHIHFGGHVEHSRRPTAATAPSGIRRKPCRRWPTTPRSSAGAASTSTRCGCGRRARPIRSTSMSSTPATTSAPAPRKRARKRSANSSIPTTRAPAGRELRLRQEYFFVSACLQDLVKRHLSADGQLRMPRAKGRRAAQRHPSEPCGHRADAHPGRPAQFPLGRGVEDHGRDAVLHQPHAAAGGAGDLAGRTVRAAAAAASARSSTASTSRISRSPKRAAPATSNSAPRSR